MSKSLLTLEESKTFCKAIFKTLQESPIENLSVDTIANPEGNPYRPSDRLHNSKNDEKDVEGLSSQIEDLSLLHPIIVVDEGDLSELLIIASGLKRLKAARDRVLAKRINLQDICKSESAGWSLDKKRAALCEALQSVVFTESETNSKLSDESVVSLLKTIRTNQEVDSFDAVMPRLALKRDDSTYRNIKRLWGVVANDALYQAFQSGLVPLEVAKRDKTQKIFEQTDKRDDLLARLKEYQSQLIEKNDLNATKQRIEEMDGYSRADMDAFVEEIAQTSEDEKEETFANPVFDIEAKNGFVSIPKIDNLKVTDTSRKNVAKVLDVFYNLSVICSQIEGFLNAVKPDEVGGKIKKDRALSFGIQPAAYGDHYIDFLSKYNMHFYSKSSAVDSHYEKERDLLLPISERKGSKSELPAKLVEAFIKRVKSSKAEKAS